jgi:hypothetical protein
MTARRCAAALALLLVVGGGEASLHAATAGAAPPGSPSPAAGTVGDIRDIHGPVTLPPARPLWPYLAGGALAAGIAVGFVLLRRRPALSAAERALRALAEADATGTSPRKFSFAVSDIVRSYVEAAFAVRAAHRTTEELLGDLMRDTSPVAGQRDVLGDFLHWCDLAKFAGWSLSRAEMTSMLASAEAFVRATSTRSPAPTSSPGSLRTAEQGVP